MNTRFLPAIIIVSVLVAVPATAADFVLVREGEPQAQIVLGGKDASGPAQFAAEELQRYVRIMSGAVLPIVPAATDQPAVIMMVDPRLAAAADARQAKVTGQDRYLLEVSERRITISGASPRAVLFATYDLLERLGCGWCVPGDDSVPKRSTVSIASVKVDTTPTFQYRMMLDYPLLSLAQSAAIVDWIAKNRLNWVHPCPNAFGEPQEWYDRRETIAPEIRQRGLHLIVGGHTMHTWVPQENFAEHPDWFAYNDGERKPPTLCVSNTDMTAELVRNMQRFLNRCPEVDVVDLWHPDMEVFCHCPVCTQGLVPTDAKGRKPDATPADAVKSAHAISHVKFLNRVAEAIAKSHPKVMISPLIYGATDRAMPDGCPAPADNLLVGLAHIARDSYRPLAGEPKSAHNARYLGNDLTWMAQSKNHYIYEYYNCWVPPYIYPGAQIIVRDLQILEHVGAQGSSSDMYGYTPCNMYVAARALWSPDISWEAVVRDFHMRYYGDVGSEMGDNEVYLVKGLFGTAGYGSGGALNPPDRQADSGRWLNEIRPKQIALIEGLIARTTDPLVKARLERAVKPWKIWGDAARWWAFPPFVGAPEADERRMAQCPPWAKETVPAQITPYLGRCGMPEPFHTQKELVGYEVTGMDLWQANHFVTYRPETADFLYSQYTPLRVDYKPGTLPSYERIVADVTAGLTNDREKALALLRVVPEKLVLHPGIVPLGPPTPKDRGLGDEALLSSGRAWCNEQARVFVRLCQVAGIPARLIFLFYAPAPSGHVIAEFYADGRWSMADASYLCVFPAADGHLMSAAECHSAGKLQTGEAYVRRFQEMLTYSDERMAGGKFQSQGDLAERNKRVANAAEGMRNDYRSQTSKSQADQLWVFGVMNYPLPR